MVELTIETIRDAPRILTDCPSEFKIRCKFVKRGCGFIELGKFDKHIKDCGYSLVVCSNQGCEKEFNKRDLIHHETTVCKHRKPKCENCTKMHQD